MQIPILNGIYTDNGPDLRTSYPVNMVPVPKQSGISNGFLRPGDGIVANGSGPGVDRGGINWNGVCYRVMGTKLVTVASNGAVTVLGDVGGPVNTLVTFDYSFDLLAIASGTRLYYWNPATNTLTQNTDPDLGIVLDVVWVDGYFMTTDGEFLIVTELTNPLQVNPLKYGSSEVDPDPVVALLKLRNEIYALNRNTIEVFDNIGGTLFPFNRIDGAQIQKGVVGTFACCVYMEQIAFLGSGRNEAPSIYMGAAATAQKISTQEIDELLLNYTEAQLATVKMEARNDKAHQHLYVHLPDRTLVYDGAASQVLGEAVWFTLTTTVVGFSQYRARNLVWAYDKWLVGDPQSSNIGYLVDTIGTHWGQKVRWEFGTLIVYNEGNGALFHELELVSLTGRVALGIDPQISTSYSLDGLSWSQDRFIRAGTIGNTKKRLAWFQQGNMRNWRIQRFRGDSDSHIAFARLEAQIEGLAY
ncbi:Bacteriophage P22, Gp10, DNA-stabilising [uncultured Caudovirales phage]|uniref:Bacteriophage P22, Gp10, DNA-stabilising n=1 Tax=uncultured Caudovirales phage TaxID=2100421 RepID=A0A6J5M604_9CAUD|nr:Bacteriophage P22, Gp10, DNA-stabilising [uncultured Caudovirales phage]